MCGVYTTGRSDVRTAVFKIPYWGGRPGFQKARYPTGRDGSVMLTATTTTLDRLTAKGKGIRCGISAATCYTTYVSR